MAKKFKPLRKKIHIPIYEADVWIVLNDDLESGVAMLPKSIRAHYDPQSDGAAAAICFEQAPVWGLVFRPDYTTTGIIHHEVAHIVRSLFAFIGHIIDPENDEPVSYLEQWLNDEVSYIINK